MPQKHVHRDAGMTPQDILNIFKKDGPQTGWQLLDRSRLEALPLWQMLRRTPGVRFESVGKRFLRLDRDVEGYARLSPSIRREFLTYTVLGMEDQRTLIHTRVQILRQEIQRISRTKFNLAREAMASVAQALPQWEALKNRVCFLIAGDITYDMAHAVPRPEVSTGRMVRGSDLDIIAVAEDGVSHEDLQALDDTIFKKKHFLLVHPDYQEEIDYLVKNLFKVHAQLAFDTFEHMIAAKILHEGQLLYGSPSVFQAIKKMVEESGVSEKIRRLEQQALKSRIDAEAALLHADPKCRDGAFYNLFYTREEGDEIY